jgi:hypothetical protein
VATENAGDVETRPAPPCIVGSAFLIRVSDTFAQLRIVHVEPDARDLAT